METPSFDRLVVGRSVNGVEISYDPVNSHAATHIEDTPALLGLLQELLPTLEVSTDDDTVVEVDMGRPVGLSDLVETDSADSVYYALRKNRDKPIPFVNNRTPSETSLVTVVIKPLNDSASNLHSAWVGPLVPSIPGDEKETPESRDFWANHAIIAGSQEIQAGSETTECPW